MSDNPATALLGFTKSLQALRIFIMEGGVVEILADTDLAAARTAFAKIRHAKNPHQQLWSSINHLEVAHERFRRIYHGKNSLFIQGSVYFERISHKDRFVLCLMASCYKLLGEDTLCRQSLDQAAAIDDERFWSLGGGGVGDLVVGILDPRTYRELYVRITGQNFKVDVEAFKKGLL